MDKDLQYRKDDANVVARTTKWECECGAYFPGWNQWKRHSSSTGHNRWRQVEFVTVKVTAGT